MDPTSFQLNVSVPADARFAESMRHLAAHAARYAGCDGPAAEAYGETVAAAVRACVAAAAGGDVPMVVRRGDGPLEFLIACERRVDVGPIRDDRITVGWAEEAGRLICRVARAMPGEA